MPDQWRADTSETRMAQVAELCKEPAKFSLMLAEMLQQIYQANTAFIMLVDQAKSNQDEYTHFLSKFENASQSIEILYDAFRQQDMPRRSSI